MMKSWFSATSSQYGVTTNVPRVTPGGEKTIFAVGDEAGDAMGAGVDNFKELSSYLPTYNNDRDLTFY